MSLWGSICVEIQMMREHSKQEEVGLQIEEFWLLNQRVLKFLNMAPKFFDTLPINLGVYAPPLIAWWPSDSNWLIEFRGLTLYELSSWVIKGDAASILFAGSGLEPWATMWEVWLLWGCHTVRKPSCMVRTLVCTLVHDSIDIIYHIVIDIKSSQLKCQTHEWKSLQMI